MPSISSPWSSACTATRVAQLNRVVATPTHRKQRHHLSTEPIVHDSVSTYTQVSFINYLGLVRDHFCGSTANELVCTVINRLISYLVFCSFFSKKHVFFPIMLYAVLIFDQIRVVHS